jgi:hypothetical protein
MIIDLEPNSFIGPLSRECPEPTGSFVIHKKAARGRNAALTYDQLLSGSAPVPAYVLRRVGLLDPLNESLTRYHE